jgi:AcrR family transcriptional regulator
MPRQGLDSEAVVLAAAQIADTNGLAELTLARVADVLGLRSPSLYVHIDSLEDLRRRVGALGAQELAAALHRAAAGRSGFEALHAVAVAYRSYAHEYPGRYAALQRPALGDPDAAARVVEVVVAALQAYGLEGEEAIHAVRIVRSALHGFVMLEAVGGFAMPVELDDTYERLVAVLDQGLGAVKP